MKATSLWCHTMVGFRNHSLWSRPLCWLKRICKKLHIHQPGLAHVATSLEALVCVREFFVCYQPLLAHKYTIVDKNLGNTGTIVR